MKHSNEKPILFKGEMVRAILDGRKTQTRRIVDVSPERILTKEQREAGFTFSFADAFGADFTWLPKVSGNSDDPKLMQRLRAIQHLLVPVRHPKDTEKWGDCPMNRIYCPFADEPGDRLWVKETFTLHTTAKELGNPIVFYRARNDEILSKNKWKPSIFMPRWASRLALEIKTVRVERLQDISEEDAKKEGVQQFEGGYFNYIAGEPFQGMTAKQSFETLWQSIHGSESWQANPWLWVIEFKRI